MSAPLGCPVEAGSEQKLFYQEALAPAGLSIKGSLRLPGISRYRVNPRLHGGVLP